MSPIARTPEEPGSFRPGLNLDLDLRICPTCRRELLPWQSVCPEDGAEGVHASQIPPADDPLLGRFDQEDPS